MREKVLDELRASFRPEFLNRVDDVILFDRLSQAAIGAIVDLQFAEVQGRARARGLDVRLSDAAREWLAEHGYDPTYGARPLRRLFQQAVLDPLALNLLQGRFLEGSSVFVDVGDGEIRFAETSGSPSTP